MTLLLRIILNVSIVALACGCVISQEARIEPDYSNSGNFRRYRTYDFLRNRGLSSDTSRLALVLRDAIQTCLQQQGYRPATNRPDLLVNFRIFEGAVNQRGYNQEELDRWVAQLEADDVNGNNPEQKSPHTYEPVRRLLTDGTLLVTLVDARSQRAIWNGYASGVDVPDTDRAEIVLRRSVRCIFDRYRILAKGYVLSPESTEAGALAARYPTGRNYQPLVVIFVAEPQPVAVPVLVIEMSVHPSIPTPLCAQSSPFCSFLALQRPWRRA